MMIFVRAGLIAAFAMLSVAPVGGVALAAATDAADTPAPRSTPAEPAAGEAPAAETGAEAAQDKRICRYVKLETASRRKTKVCRTLEEWRELNNPR
jgi:hypothetical protein